MTSLAGMRFDNHLARLGSRFSTPLPPTPLPEPYLVSANPDAAALIDLDPEQLHTPEFVGFLRGGWLPPGSEPVAMLYAGHQFGHYVPQLGDGRALLTGQIRNARDKSWDLKLKGAGATPYSRMADGRAVLRLRNWLAQRAIERAQQKDFTEVDRLLALPRRPFDDQPGSGEYAGPAPADLFVPAVSCSS